MRLYLATELRQADHAPSGAEEHAAELVSVPLAEIVDVLDRGEVRDAKTLIGLLWLAAHHR
jgi:hypothetical protein